MPAASTPAPPTRTLSRALPGAPADGAAPGGGAPSAAGGGGGSGGGHSSDLIYGEMLRRVREEQEQLGQLINHPF